MKVFYGTLVHSLSPSQLEILEKSALFVDEETGVIAALETGLESESALQDAIKRHCIKAEEVNL
jgi:hypothetical protein